MATLERRVQVLFDPERYKELEAAARDAGMSVGAFIREAIDERLAERSTDRLAILKELFAQADSVPQRPLPDWEELKADYENEMDPVHRLARNDAEAAP